MVDSEKNAPRKNGPPVQKSYGGVQRFLARPSSEVIIASGESERPCGV